MVVIIIILSLVISFGFSSVNLVEKTGDNESALVEESSGIHLLEINESGKGDTGSADWSWMKVAFVVIGLKFGQSCNLCTGYLYTFRDTYILLGI